MKNKHEAQAAALETTQRKIENDLLRMSQEPLRVSGIGIPGAQLNMMMSGGGSTSDILSNTMMKSNAKEN